MSDSKSPVTLSMLPTLAKGTVPLFKTGVLGNINPLVIPSILKTVWRWEFLPAGILGIAAARDPKHTAIIDDAGELTYEELNNQVEKLSQSLAAAGLGEGSRIGMLSRNHRGFLTVLCAVGRLGADLVLFNTGASAQQTHAVLREQEVDQLFIDEEFIPLLPKGFDHCPVTLNWEEEANTEEPENVLKAESAEHAVRDPEWNTREECLKEDHSEQELPFRPRRGRTIILTSGTTGTPKGARRPEPRTYLPASSIMSRIPLKHHERYYIAAPLFHTWGFAQLQLALALRATMVFKRKFSPEGAKEVIDNYRPHTIAIVPTMLKRLVEILPDDYDCGVEVIAASGEPLAPKLIKETTRVFGKVLYNLYGSTEVSWASIAQPDELAEHPATAGKPPFATTLLIVDDNDEPITTDGEIGRIFVGNDMLFEGYTRADAQKSMLNGLVATGDLAYIEDGLIYIAGRSDDMIVSGGENVYPQETEDVISEIDGVDEVAVRGVDDEKFGQALAAWVVLTDGVDEEEFRTLAKKTVSEKLARHSVPRHYKFVDKLPRNAVGKVVPRELPKIDS